MTVRSAPLKKGRTITTIRMRDDLLAALKVRARQLGVSRSYLIERVLLDYAAEHDTAFADKDYGGVFE